MTRRPSRTLLCLGLWLLLPAADAQATALYGVYARGQDLDIGTAQDGGVGFAAASVSAATYAAEGSLGGSTYTPVLRAESVSVAPQNSDDRVDGRAEAYQTFTSSIAQTITLDLSFHSVVTPVAYALADVQIKGGPTHMVQDGYCNGGIYTFPNGVIGFGAYLCGSTLGTANLYNNDGDVTLTDSITFDVAAGESFTVWARLIANSYGGASDAFHTLEMSFVDDTGLTAASVPAPAPIWLFGSGLAGLARAARRSARRAA